MAERKNTETRDPDPIKSESTPLAVDAAQSPRDRKEAQSSFWQNWNQRLRALSNIPPLIKIVWNSGPGVVTGGMLCRLIGALVPVTMLAVSKRILDGVQAHTRGHPLPTYFW